MLDSEAPQVPYHEAPEACYAHSGPERVLDSEAPKVPYHEAPEVYYEAPKAVPTTIFKHDGDAPKDIVQQRKTEILGLSPVLFWVLMALTFLIIGGAIGGGVGGSAAQRHRSRLAASTSPLSIAKAIVSIIVSTRYVRSTTSDTIVSPSTIIQSSILSTSSLPIDHTTGCPASNGTIYSSQGGAKMLIACGDLEKPFFTNSHNVSVDMSNADSLHQCLERCFTRNRSHAPADVCHTVAYGYLDGDYEPDPYCWVTNVTYPGQNIENDFGHQTTTAFGFLLDEAGNIN